MVAGVCASFDPRILQISFLEIRDGCKEERIRVHGFACCRVMILKNNKNQERWIVFGRWCAFDIGDWVASGAVKFVWLLDLHVWN